MKKSILWAFIMVLPLGVVSQTQTAESVVQGQVEAYNLRDIDAFMSFYSEDVKIYQYPNVLETEGKEAMRKRYASFFQNATTLHCKITKRIVQNQVVIDEELVHYNDRELKGVAVYTVENGKIVRVTFIL